MADAKKTLGHALLQAFGLDDQRVKRLSLNIKAGDAPLLTVTVYPRDVSAQQIEAIATEYEIISRSELRDIRERLAAVQQAEPVHNCCWCHKCNAGQTINGMPFAATRMIVCPDCGNKRCPRANDHRLACTNSNEPVQPIDEAPDGR